MLKIVKYIRKYGLDKAISDFKLICKDDGERILLKYNQIESNMGIPEVQECRGLILEKKTLRVLCLPFFKFFNSAEGYAAKIDWSTAHILEKLDGSLITLYSYNNKWFAATSGMIQGEGEVNNKLGSTFHSLFMDIMETKYNFDLNTLNKDYNFVFELTTPYNIVVKPHAISSITLLTVRNVKTLQEISYDELIQLGHLIGLPVVKSYDLNVTDSGALIRTLEGMPWTDEGYVVVDGYHNRIKIKNPAYLAVHHLKSKTGEHNILGVVKTNEIDEFGATFPERLEEIKKLKANYDKLISDLNSTWEEIKTSLPKNITKQEQKKFAMKVFEISKKMGVAEFSGLFFSLKDKKVESVSEFMFNYDNKKLYKIL
jgi:T4 RnlA family RNA ligase